MESAYPDYEKVNSLEQLRSWLKLLQRDVKAGALEQFWPNRYVTDSPENISDFHADGMLPDFICVYVREHSTGIEYMLAVEKYHGGGGAWEVLTR